MGDTLKPHSPKGGELVIAWWIYLAGILPAWALGTWGAFVTERKERPSIYNDSDYQHRNAPHSGDYALGFVCAVLWPLVLGFGFWAMVIGGFSQWRKSSWKKRQQDRAAKKQAIDDIAKIVEEINAYTENWWNKQKGGVQ